MEYTPPFYPAVSTIRNRDRQFKVVDPKPNVSHNCNVENQMLQTFRHSPRFMAQTSSNFSTVNDAKTSQNESSPKNKVPEN